eukprot:179000-Prymnesium_polylepis.1
MLDASASVIGTFRLEEEFDRRIGGATSSRPSSVAIALDDAAAADAATVATLAAGLASASVAAGAAPSAAAAS